MGQLLRPQGLALTCRFSVVVGRALGTRVPGRVGSQMPWGAPGTQEGRLTSGVRGGWLSRKPARGTLADPGPEPGSPVGGCRRPRCVDGPFLLVPWSGLQTLRGHRSPAPTQASLPAPGSPRAIGGALRRGDDGVVPPLGREGWNDRCEHGHGPLPYPEAVRHSRLSVRCSLFRNKTANGDCRKDPRERSRSPIERAVAPTMSLHSGPLYASLPSLSMEQPLALTKNSLDAGRPAGLSPTLAPVERQQVHLCRGGRDPIAGLCREHQLCGLLRV